MKLTLVRLLDKKTVVLMRETTAAVFVRSGLAEYVDESKIERRAA